MVTTVPLGPYWMLHAHVLFFGVRDPAGFDTGRFVGRSRVLPIPPQELSEYAWALARTGLPPAGVRRHLKIICWAHRDHGFPSPKYMSPLAQTLSVLKWDPIRASQIVAERPNPHGSGDIMTPSSEDGHWSYSSESDSASE